MFNRGIRWERILLATVISVAILFLAYSAYEEMNVKRPLLNLLEKHPSVISFSVVEKDGAFKIKVLLQDVSDLKTSFDDLYFAINDSLGQNFDKIVVEDKSDEVLEDAYDAIHYYVYEAAEKSDFGDMIVSCEKILSEKGIDDYRLVVDEERLYVQMREKDNYLYRIVERRGRL